MAGQEHEPQPRRDVNAAWDEVGARFADLGRLLKERQQHQAEADPTAPDAPPESGPTRQVMDAIDDAFTALGDTVRDEAFRREARGSLQTLGAALGVTFSELGEHLRERFEKPKR